MRVVIVDDVKDVLDTMSISLQVEGYDVKSYSCPIEALSYLEESYCDLIITDVLMPKMNGYDFLLQVRNIEAHKKVPIISMSGGAVGKSNIKVLDDIVPVSQGFMKKPIHPAELIDLVAKMISKNAMEVS